MREESWAYATVDALGAVPVWRRIRSATFNLGILQGLARHRLLQQFDYLSTVSGGGFGAVG